MALAIAAGLGSTAALAQTATSTGEIQARVPAADIGPKADVPQKKLSDRKRKATVKQRTRGLTSKPRIQSQVTPRPQLKAETKIKRRPKLKRADRLQPPLAPKIDSAGQEECWQSIQAALQPARLIKLSEECERDFPASRYTDQIRRVAVGAQQTLEIQRSIGLSSDFFEESVGDAAYRDDLHKAVRGDKDAAYRVAIAYRAGTSGVAVNSRRTEQWLRFSAELGNGRASWELAEIYNYSGLVADAARFEKKALDLGYRPSPRLPTRGY